MSKFPYKYDINKYLEKAKEIIFDSYPWATEDMLDDKYEYKIEKVGGVYEFVSYYHNYDGEILRKVLTWIKSDSDFYDYIKDMHEYSIQSKNPKYKTFKVPISCGTMLHGWYLERYEFNKHFYGGYSAFVQAGDRVTGGSRTFFIPQDYFDGSFDEFLDKYVKLVSPGAFGMSKEDLKNAEGLKKFLGFKE